MTAESDVDKIVFDNFFSAESKPGVFVDVGAARPDYLSISALFRSKGWKVLSVEPNPEFCAAHRAAGYTVFQYACSDVESDDVEFFVFDSKNANYAGYLDGHISFESFSSLGMNESYARVFEAHKETISRRTIPVKVRRLNTILTHHEPDLDKIDVLAIDVEGWELSVLRGFDLERYEPKVVVVENLFSDPQYQAYMNDHGYAFWRSLPPNEIYTR